MSNLRIKTIGNKGCSRFIGFREFSDPRLKVFELSHPSYVRKEVPMCKFCSFMRVAAGPLVAVAIGLMAMSFFSTSSKSEPAPAYETCSTPFAGLQEAFNQTGDVSQASMQKPEVEAFRSVLKEKGGSLYDETVKVTFWKKKGANSTLVTETDDKGCVLYAQVVSDETVEMYIKDMLKYLEDHKS